MRISGLVAVAVTTVSASAAPERGGRVDRYGDPLPPGAVARVGTVRLRNPGTISGVALSPDGKTLVTIANYQRLRVWNATTGALVREIPFPQDDGPDHPPGRPLVPTVNVIKFLPNSPRLHALTQDGRLWVCNLADGVWGPPVARTEFPTEVRRFATGWPSADEASFLYRPMDGKTTELFAADKDKPVYRLGAEKYGQVGSLTRDLRLLVAMAVDGTAKVWDLKADKVVSTFRPPDGLLFNCAISPDGNTAAAVCGPKHTHVFGQPAPPETTLYAWDVATGQELYRTRGWEGHAVSFSPDGGRLVSLLGREVLVADAKTGKLVHRLKGHGGWGIFGFAFSADGARLVTGSRDHSAVIWDLTTGKTALDFDSPRGPVDVVALSPNGKTVFAGCAEDHTGGLWDADTGRRLHRLDADHKGNPLAAAFTPDGRHVVLGYGKPRATGTGNDWAARLWSVAEGKVVREFGGHTDGVHQLAVSPDGTTLATRDWGRKVRLWDLGTGKMTRDAGWVPYNTPVALAYPRADALIGANTVAGGVEMTDLIAGKATGQLKMDAWASSLALSSDGRRVAISGYPRERHVILRDTVSGVRAHADVEAGNLSVMAFSPDGRTIAVTEFRGGIDGGAVHLLDATTGERRRTVQGHRGTITGLAFSRDGKRLATGGQDSTVLVWDLTATP